jgi:colanic acid/amylovoran biosynthesis protein
MLIQLHGAGFHNRGAQLMLWTAAQEIRSRIPGARIAMEATASTYQQRAGYDLLTLVPKIGVQSPRRAKFFSRAYSVASHLLPRGLDSAYGLARRCDVDAFVDISGYAFGDKWPVSATSAVAGRVSSFRKAGKPVVLLPQMLGPFDNTSMKRAFSKIVANTDLLYARDHRSLESLKAFNDPRCKIQLAPDITIFGDSRPPRHPVAKRYACLVPNMRMRDKAADTWGENYLTAMVNAGEHLLECGVAPYIVVHDGGNEDTTLAVELAGRLKLADSQIYREQDPLRIKGFMAGGIMTIGSRFHALVSSLAMGVPVITLGWAHKYEELMKDFGVQEFFCSYEQGSECTREPVQILVNSTKRREVVGTIEKRKSAMKDANDQMWKDVCKLLTKSMT